MRSARRSAKGVIVGYANELLSRINDKDVQIKLLTIETIAFKMGWNDLYDRLRFRGRNEQVRPDKVEIEDEKPEPWWQK